MEIGHRDLGRRDQVEVVACHDVHLVFLSGIWPVPRADSALETAGGQISVIPFWRVWTSRNQLMSARWSADPAPL